MVRETLPKTKIDLSDDARKVLSEYVRAVEEVKALEAKRVQERQKWTKPLGSAK